MYFLLCESLNFCFESEASELDSDGEPSASSVVRKWRAQKLEDDERILLQEKVFNAEEHFRNMCAAGGVSNKMQRCSISVSKMLARSWYVSLRSYFQSMFTCVLIV